MFILGVSHHTWWTAVGTMINVVALTYYFFKAVPVKNRIRLANVLIVLFAGICIGAIVFPLAGWSKVFALGCVRGNGAALVVHWTVRRWLKQTRKK